MAILDAEGPGKTGDNLSDFLTGEQVRLLWHPSLSETTPKEAAEIIDRILTGEEELTILCVEGSIINFLSASPPSDQRNRFGHTTPRASHQIGRFPFESSFLPFIMI